MKWIMLTILVFILMVALGALLAAGRFALSPRMMRQSKLLERLRQDERGSSKLLAVPLVAWMLLFLLVLVVLLFVSAMCLMYTYGLLHGEWVLLLGSFTKTAGNIVVHLIYPLQVVLFALATFLLAVGGFQLIFGPVEGLSRFKLRVEEVTDLARKLAALIAIAAGLEVLKILFYSLLVVPEELSNFFARDALPKAEPLGVALLAAALLVAVAAWWKAKDRDR